MRYFGLIAASTALLLSAPSSAQVASGHSGTSSAPRSGTTDEFWWTVRQMGQCFAGTKNKQARALIATEPNTSAEQAVVGTLFGRATMCVRGASRISLPTSLVRGSIAEALYKKEVKALPPADATAASTLVRDELPNMDPYRVLTDVARCYARREPAQVHAFLTTTKLAEADERARFETLLPALSGCLPPNVRIVFDSTDVRFALAEALYKRAASGATGAKQAAK